MDDALEKYESMQKGRVVELYGPAFTGKTATLMHIAITGLLPRALGGNGMTVTWVDCDGRFSLPRFQEMALARVREALQGPGAAPQQDAEALTAAAMESLRLYSLPSSRHLLELLRRIAEGETALPGGLTKQMLVIDPISAYYWIDAMESSDELRIFKRVCQQIARLDMAIFVAKSPLYARREKAAHREYLGESWARLVKYRLVLWPEPLTPYASASALQQQQQGSDTDLRARHQQRRRPLAPQLGLAAASASDGGGGGGAAEQEMLLPCFGAQRLLPAGSDVTYSFTITTAGIVVLGAAGGAAGSTAVKGTSSS